MRRIGLAKVALIAFSGLLLLLLHLPAGWTLRALASGDETPLKSLKAGELYSLTVSVKDPAAVTGAAEIRVQVEDGAGALLEKTLHAGDLDLYLTLRPRANGAGAVRLRRNEAARSLEVAVDLRPIRRQGTPAAAIAAQPNSNWQQAQEFRYGQTLFGASDERPYTPAPSEDTYQALLKGFQWFKFTFPGSSPRLVYFVLNVLDRDVPPDVDIFTVGTNSSAEPDVVPYKEGVFVYQPEATQNFPGLYKFRTRILKPGQTYYLRVAANHPAFQLRTYEYPAPPYDDPRLAVRAGMDFLINMGDSWHGNTPRRGAVALRNTQPHSETQLCIACHPTQFPLRGYLTAVANSYPVTQRDALKFLTERIYNNPRPLYGHPDTNWVRVIYSARTVASRIPHLMSLFEKHVSGEPTRAGFDTGYGKFLRLHYADVKEIPGNEADGCAPDVSQFEIAAQSWQTFDLLARRASGTPEEGAWRAERDRVESMTLARLPANFIDLNWKIAALAMMGREKYRAQIETLIEQLYGWQTEKGQWPYRFEKNGQPSDFITFHAIWALALAGRRPESDPKLARSVQYCLRAQRPEGSWQGDPIYKGFNTPFRDTQFAVMALSTLYPGPGNTKNRGSDLSSKENRGSGSPNNAGWGAAFPEPPNKLHTRYLDELLAQLDQYWTNPGENVLRQIRSVVAENPHPLGREAAASALGRVGDAGAVPVLVKALGDPTKVVQRAAAWALREIAVRRGAGRAELAAALRSPDSRVRWGSTRLFNQHFRDLTGSDALLDALAANLDHPAAQVRFHAASALWRWHYWQVDHEGRRGKILEALAARMGRETDPIVRRALLESVYNVLDENVGYLQAWVRATARDEDRRKIREGFEAVARQQAQILARALQSGNRLAREGLLTALWDFHIRHFGVPDKSALTINLPAVFTQYVPGVPDLHRPGYEYPPYREAAAFRYSPANGFQQTRIGNDSELIYFFSSTGPKLEQALLACLRGADSEMKMNVLKAGSTLAQAGTDAFALAALRLAFDSDPQVRTTLRYVFEKGTRGVLNLEPVNGTYGYGTQQSAIRNPQSAILNPYLADVVVEILEKRPPEGLAVVLPMLALLEPDSSWTREPRVVAGVRALMDLPPTSLFYGEALKGAAAFDSLLADSTVQQRILAAMQEGDKQTRRAAMEIVVRRFLNAPALEPRARVALLTMDDDLRVTLYDALARNQFKPSFKGRPLTAQGSDSVRYYASEYAETADPVNQPAIVESVASSIRHGSDSARSAAVDLLNRRREMLDRPQIQLALASRVSGDAEEKNPRVKRLIASLLEGRDIRRSFENADLARLLDYVFFVEQVQPILARPGADGKACVQCHASHAIFKLQPPDEAGRFSETVSRENYRYALAVVDVAQPERSLLLIKPTRPTDSAADANNYLATHNGGQRWTGNESSTEYRTILEWIRGSRLPTERTSAR